jgi:hypothetical protein
LKPLLKGVVYALSPKMKSSVIDFSPVGFDGAGVLTSSPLLLPSGCAYQKIETKQLMAKLHRNISTRYPRLASQIISF